MVRTGVAYGFIIFLFLFLSHLSINLTLKPQSSALSHPNPLLSNPNPYCSSTPMSTLTPTIESGIEPNNELNAKDTFFSEIKSPNEVGTSPSSAFNERFKESRYAYSVTEVGIFPLSLLSRFGSNGGGWVWLGVMSVWVGDVGVGIISVWVCYVGQQ